MRIKRYVASEVSQAIRSIREELGPDAVILSNRKVDGGVEIAAAVDYDDDWLDSVVPEARDDGARPSSPAPERDTARAAVKPAADTSEGSADRYRWPPKRSAGVEEVALAPGIDSVERELKTLRGLLEQQLSGLAWGDLARRHPLQASVLRKLLELGLSRPIATTVCNDIADSSDPRVAWRNALGSLAHRVQTVDHDLLSHGGRIAFLGPTGVGKTTTVAKLAARYALVHGARKVALVTTDSYRVGAQEQLRTYADIMGVPLRVANGQEDLQLALGDFGDRELVLIDTAGMSQRDVRFSEQVASIGAGDIRVKSYLVLSATSQFLSMDEAVRVFRGANPDACVITKTDEATSLGGILSVVIQHAIPVAYVSDGQRVPEDIGLAQAHRLVARAVSISQPLDSGGDDEDLDLAYGGLTANAR